MKFNKKTAAICIIICVIIGVVPLIFDKGAEFGGSDDAASDEISQITGTDYKPWITPLFTPPSTEAESLLFCIQTGIGAGIFGFCAGRLYERKKKNRDNDEL
jgi:cobalt/nickel transport protein